jgi:propanediol dehydratase large subunit
MAKRWHGLHKVQEEMNELGVELMKLAAFPDGKHPSRKRSLVLSAEDECADALQAIDYFIARNKLNRDRIMQRWAMKRKKFVKWMGDPYKSKKKTSKKTPKTKIASANASVARRNNDKRT